MIKRVLIVLAVMLLAAFVVPSLAQEVLELVWSQQCTGEVRVRGQVVECWEEVGPQPTPTATATAEPTVEPTATPTTEPTVEPTATPTAAPGGVPLCAHDPLVWHDLYDETQGCRHTHEHGEDPSAANDLFGEPGAWFGQPGTVIGGPFAMPPEMTTGHNIFKWYVRRDLTPDQQELVGDNGAYIKDFRAMTHVAPGGDGAKKRFHSFLFEMQVCRPAEELGVVDLAFGRLHGLSEQCGILRQAGLFDMANFYLVDRSPGTVELLLLPRQGDGQHEYLPGGNRFHPIGEDGRARVTWYPRPWSAPQAGNGIQIEVMDGWSRAVPNAARDDVTMVPYNLPGYNGSLRQLHVVFAVVYGEGSGAWITDQHGRYDSNCTALGQAQCGYTVFENLFPTGLLRYGERAPEINTEYDTSPVGESWIVLPN